jgi:ATP-dependent 26S proteasome regulatory subunit
MIHARARFAFSLLSLIIGISATPALIQADPVDKEFASLVQHFAYISYNAIAESAKTKAGFSALTASDAHVVKKVEESYRTTVDSVRKEFLSHKNNDHTLQSFGNYILGLTHELGLRDAYFMKLPRTMDPHASSSAQLALIKKGIDVLETRFAKIKPVTPILKRIENLLFYNFVSTKVIPKLLSFGVGPALTLAWSARNIAKYDRNISRHPHIHMFKHYEKVEHDKKITWVKKPSLIERAMGVKEKKETINPCQDRYSDNCCNGDHYRGTRTVEQEFDNPIASMFAQGFAQVNSGFIAQREEEIEWAHACHDQCKDCYHYRGYHSPEKIAGKLTWAARPLVLLPALYFLGKVTEEAQLPEYEHRIKEKQKQLLEQKVQQEMRRLKVNYEQEIGFDQIKGQQLLIDREMRLMVDYLTNPLRYKNSSSGTRSLLMYGPPGTGKTLMARAIAKESGAPFLEITADDILSDNSKEKILGTIRLAEEIAAKRPEKSAIIYIDEIDAVTGNRQKDTLDPQRAKALSNLLTIFDGIEKRNPFLHIVIIITTNHYKNLDPALLRPGRIDRKILITQPDAAGRAEFFETLLPAECKQYMEWLIKETAGYSGAQIVNVTDTAQMIASYNNRSIPSEQDYRASLENSKVESEAMPEDAKTH